MDIIAVDKLVNDYEQSIGTFLPANLMDQALNALKDCLVRYDVALIPYEDPDKDILLDAFLDAIKVEGRSEKTIERYRYILRRFLDFAGVGTRSISVYHIRKYISSEKDRGISDTTLNGIRDVFNAYFGWLHRDNLIERNPMANVGCVKCQKKVKEVYSDVDLEKLKSSCMCIRDKAILYFLKATGCRISEVTQLNRNDVDLVNKECTVLGKGNKQRTVYFDAVTGMQVKKYLESRKDESEALFVGKGSERLTPGGIRFMLCRLGAAAGVEHVHPHKFRRTQITDLVSHGMPIELVKDLAGHDKLDTTMGYVVIDKANVKNAYHKYYY